MAETPKEWGTRRGKDNTQDWRHQSNRERHAGGFGDKGGMMRSTRGGRGVRGRGGMASRGRGSSNMHMFVTRDMEPRNQHDMRAFVMAARLHAETQKLSEAISWLGDPLKFGLSRVMDICRRCSTDLDVNAGTSKDQVSFQRVFLPLIDLAVSTEFRNSPLRSETNVLFSTLYKLERADGLWTMVFDNLEELAERGTVEDWNYTEHNRSFENEQHHAVWEPFTWADVALPIARFMVEVTKRFRDEVLVDKEFQTQATQTLPSLITKWKKSGGSQAYAINAVSPSRAQLFDVDDAMANLNRVMGAALRILQASEEARAEREDKSKNLTTRSDLFHLSDSTGGKNEGYDGPGSFSSLGVRRHDNDAEKISEISVRPTAGEILCARPSYLPSNDLSKCGGMTHLKPLEADSPAAVMDIHFRLLREDFIQPLREAVLAYRTEQLRKHTVKKTNHGFCSERKAEMFKRKTAIQ